MRKYWFALLFFMGGFATEVRHPTQCNCIASRGAAGPAKRHRQAP